jgi:hypothetical protein
VTEIRIGHPILLDSLYDEPSRMDHLLDELVTKRHLHYYTVSQSNEDYGECEADSQGAHQAHHDEESGNYSVA